MHGYTMCESIGEIITLAAFTLVFLVYRLDNHGDGLVLLVAKILLFMLATVETVL